MAKTKVKRHTRKTKRGRSTVRNHTRKVKCPSGQAWDARLKRCVSCPGGKIRSKGLGRGLGRGMGKGPIGVPYRRKR